MIHVCHITSVHARFDTRIFHKECISLQVAGYRVTQIVADGLGNQTINGIAIIDVGASSSRANRILLSTFRIFTAALRIDADIYHFHDPELMPYAALLRIRGKRIIFDAHETVVLQILSKHYLPHFSLRLIASVYGVIELLLCRFFHAIVAADPNINARYRPFHNQVLTIHNYPLLKEFSNPKDQISEYPNRENAICYVGGLCRIRGILEMIASMEHTNAGTILYLAGEFSDSKDTAQSLPGWSRVNFLGHLGRSDIGKLLRKSRIGLAVLHPTANYPFALPVKMFEYMAAGIPVVVSNFPLWEDIVKSSQCGLCVDPLDITQVATSINHLLDRPDIAEQMGNNGRRAVLSRYNWERESAKLVALYNRIIPLKSSRQSATNCKSIWSPG